MLQADQHAESQAASYRDRAFAWELVADGATPIALAAVRKPRFATRLTAGLATPGLVVGALLVVYALAFVQQSRGGAILRCAREGARSGAFQPVVRPTGFGFEVQCSRTVPLLCRQMLGCDEEGLCDPGFDADPGCIAASTPDCKGSVACSEDGRCTALDEACQPATDDDCLGSQRCVDEGRCTLVVRGARRSCELASDADCQRLVECRQRGDCAFVAGACRPGDPTHCQSAHECGRSGTCAYDPERHRCVATEDDCRRAEVCLTGVPPRCAAEDGLCVSRAGALPPRYFQE
ncbi:MAG: hypothetical protein R3B72_47085 [Polyangiaceae bacterium]